MVFPKARLDQHGGQDFFRSANGVFQAIQIPFHPLRDVHHSVLAVFQNKVILIALALNLRRHAVKTLRGSFRPGQHHVGNRPRNAPVAIFKWMNGYEPKMRQRGFDDWVNVRRGIAPFDEASHFLLETVMAWRFVRDCLAPDRARPKLLAAAVFRAPPADNDTARSAPARWEQ